MYGKHAVLGVTIVGTGALPFSGAPIGWYLGVALVTILLGMLLLRAAMVRRYVGQHRAGQ